MPVRRAITLLELLVVLAILAVLMALIVPAVQVARSAAASMSCRSQLRQLTLAMHAYVADHGYYPGGAEHRITLLSYLDQAALKRKADEFGRHAITSDFVPIYRCPADSLVSEPKTGAWPASYAACSGSGVQRDGFNGMFNHAPGTYRQECYPEGFVRPADVVDGQSQTVAFGEILPVNWTKDRLRVIWYTPQAMIAPTELDAFANFCEAIPPDPPAYGYHGVVWDRHGMPWTETDSGEALYNHVVSPNRPSCFNGNAVQYGAYASASLHRGGVHVSFADGHVEFVNNSIDREVWRERGSRVAKAIVANGPCF